MYKCVFELFMYVYICMDTYIYTYIQICIATKIECPLCQQVRGGEKERGVEGERVKVRVQE